MGLCTMRALGCLSSERFETGMREAPSHLAATGQDTRRDPQALGIEQCEEKLHFPEA